MPCARERRWWTSEEDETLRSCVQIQQGNVQNWSDIAVMLPGRTNKDCRKRWSKIQLGIRKGAWTSDEDEKLRQAVQQIGFKWAQVANIVHSRNADQCAKRWQHVLGPDFKHSPWTPEEDKIFLDAMMRHGNNWRQIRELYLLDRSTHDIRNRSLILERRGRGRRSRVATSAQLPSQSLVDDDDVIGDEPSVNCDNNYCSAGTYQVEETSATTRTPLEADLDHISKIDSHNISCFQQPHTSLDTPPDPALFFGSDSIDASAQVETSPELQIGSDYFSWLNSFDITASTPATSLPSGVTNTPLGELYLPTSEPFTIGLLDTPGASDDSSMRWHTESGSETPVEGNEKKGNITLFMKQVDPHTAQEIMGSVLKHSAGLKIQCIVNDE